jgi:hypothetical protein
MLKHAEEVVAGAYYFLGDIGSSELEMKYDFISAWDSTFHLPFDMQEPALRTMSGALNSKGILVFSFGGMPDFGTIGGNFVIGISSTALWGLMNSYDS